MSQRFQKAYESLEHEAALERKKLMAEHQRRIEDELARKKTEAMNEYLDALAEDEPDVSLVSLHLYTTVSISQSHWSSLLLSNSDHDNITELQW